MQVCHITHKGLVREDNQDSLLLDTAFFGVADGMGGHNGGETASKVAVQTLKEELFGMQPGEESIRKAIEAANRRIYQMSLDDLSLSGMGTTLTLLWEDADRVWLGQVGDSRAYLYRSGELTQVTQDHSLVSELVRSGAITQEMARTHPYRNVITRAVGCEEEVVADVYCREKHVGDVWLLCSDGLYNMVPDDDIARLLSRENDRKAADRLLRLALTNGGTDNVSLVICRVTEVTTA